MQVIRHYALAHPAPCALAIGNFDGMHLGHQTLLRELVRYAGLNNLASAVMTFEPHPREFFTPHHAPARLASLREKLEWCAELGVNHVFLVRFDQTFANISSQDFLQHVLIHSIRAQAVMVGEDFRFGAGRSGGVAQIAEAGIKLITLPEVLIETSNGHQRISSTAVRNALAAGELSVAQRLLGRNYSISGTVVRGQQLGRQLGYPTANVHMRHERPALTGVYAVKLDGMPGVANLGVRPTLAGIPKLSLEVHLFDFNGDLYQRHVHVEFLHKLRDEIKFADLSALKAQIAQDVAAAQAYFSR
ncbi:MAG: bifunctional riboflavin kinase/FAD synthetase [Methylophilaceae bacterium]|jgi:riboflavin kinase/FMN adenylyltransferase|nr:bifunctional riboflavin kinase/FAD synthetase [Methylophilaceae bacterium]